MPQTPLDNLREQIALNQVVAVVGTGVSVASTRSASAASWHGLIESAITRCEQLGGVPSGWRDRMRDLLAHADLTDLLCIAENVSQRLGAPAGGEYASWLSETVGDLQVQERSLLEAIAGLGIQIVTTNYDGLIEEVTGLRHVTWRETRRVESVVRGASQGILHLHGYWEEPDSVVFGVRSYEDILRNEHAQQTLRTLRTMKTMLFVGFGDGLRDPNFGGLLKWAGQVFAESGFRHYRLCRDSEQVRIQSQHASEERILALSYGASHTDLEPFVRSLC